MIVYPAAPSRLFTLPIMPDMLLPATLYINLQVHQHMQDDKLQEELERLRLEVNQAADANDELTRKLNLLISDIEKKIDEPGDREHHDNLVETITRTINQFESEYPRATAILNDIMVTLSNMGI